MESKSFSRAAERRTERRQQIVDTASQLFSERGYENVTLRAIAERLGYAHAALYRYFPDKASLLAEICRETFAQLLVELDAQEQKARDPESKLLAVSLGFVRFGLAHPHHYQVVFSGPINQQSIASHGHLDAIGQSLFDRLIKTFLTCADAVGLSDETRRLDANTWWISLFGTTHVLISSCAVINPASSGEIVRRHIEAMWQGLRVLSGLPMAEAPRGRPRAVQTAGSSARKKRSA